MALPIPHAQAARHDGEWVTLPRLRLIPEQFRHYLEAHGVIVESVWLRVKVDVADPEPVRVGHYNGHLVAYVRSRCAQLTNDNTCALWGKPERPQVCDRYPTVDDDLSCVKPDCGFEIVEG